MANNVQKETGSTTKEAYREIMNARLKELEAEIQKLSAKAEAKKARAKIDYQEQLRSVQNRKDAVRSKLDELSRSSGEAWMDLKRGVEEAWEELKQATQRARARFEE